MDFVVNSAKRGYSAAHVFRTIETCRKIEFFPSRLINILRGRQHYNMYSFHPIDIVKVEVTIRGASSEIGSTPDTAVFRLIYG